MVPPKQTNLIQKLDLLRREGEERAAERLARELGLPYADFSKVPVSSDALKFLKEDDAKKALAASIQVNAKKIALAVADPRLPATKKAIDDLHDKKYDIKIFIASLSGLQEVWHQYKFIKESTGDITGKVSIAQKRLEELVKRIVNLAAAKQEVAGLDFFKTTPVDLIERVLASAFALKASDIHFEAEEKKAKVRLRVDGLLHDVFNELPPKNYDALVSRIKLLAGMKINVRDEAQDGRFTIGFGNKEIEIRVSVIPSEFGENIVMRILDPDVASIGIAVLGIREDDMAIVEKELSKPNGLILNTGPTGSGKTTTLYAFLGELNDPKVKIITLEDPIEYRLLGIEQTQVDTEAGYTFAKGLRAIVRQDPDVILVGEVRDLETADIAMQSALTGHLVLSTLHTNDAVGAVPRLINLGVKPVSIGPALNLIIAQRLVRKLCPDCKKTVNQTPELKSKIKKFLEKLPPRVDKSKYQKFTVYEAGSCNRCNDFGYKGRIGVFEFLEGGPDFEEVVLKEPSEVSLTKLAERRGMVTMQEDGVLKVLRGETSFEEIENITGQIEW
ncbi:MAG: type II/IV secretion system protein [Candidatus Liptonbacteria bacterium]|nr:type II/IV secretion system protein [Candidatus Liptonbacteria bacterium]